MGKIIAAIFALFKPNTSEFWTGTVNAVLQIIVRILPPDMQPEQVTAIADHAALLLYYALGRFISKVAKG